MSQPILGLQGYTVVRNAITNDYALKECVESMLACCEKVLICDSDSTDGTREMIDRWCHHEPRLTVINYPWPNPKGDGKWFVKWLNFAREHLTLPMQLELDADETICDSAACHQRLREAVERRESLLCDRLNYWRDANHLIPFGHCCGRHVVRVGPSNLWMPSDEGHPAGELPILDQAVNATEQVKIHHLGFLRRPDAFYRKARTVLAGFFNNFDTRLEPLEKESKPVWEVQNVEWTDKLVEHHGYLPDPVQRWLADRGHQVPNYLAAKDAPAELKPVISAPARNEPINVRVCGDLGDIIHCLPVLKALGAVNIYAVNRGICKALLPRLHLIKPLLESQHYVKSVQEHNGEPIHWDASDFRTAHRWTQSLCQSHLNHYRGQRHLPPVSPDFRKAWLAGIAADQRANGRVLVHRTERYNNADFPWKRVVQHYGQRLLMVGTPAEHQNFCAEFGHVDYLPTADLLEVAKLVAGATLVIAGQSCVLAIAEGMKRPRIAEVSPSQPDVVVAVHQDAQYVADGNVRLPDVAGSGEAFICGAEIDWESINTNITPPGGWAHPRLGRRVNHFRVAVADVARIADIPLPQARREILQHTVDRHPQFYQNPHKQNLLSYFQMAVDNALR